MMKMDESLAAFQALILQMYRKVKTMHELALDILRSGDKEKALQLIYMDDFVNHLEEEINDQAQTVLALLSPVATDLRKVIAGIKIASDLERIGDYAKNIADYVIKKGPAEPPFVGEQAEAIGRLFLAMQMFIRDSSNSDCHRRGSGAVLRPGLIGSLERPGLARTGRNGAAVAQSGHAARNDADE